MNGLGMFLLACAVFLFMYGCGTTADYTRDCDVSLNGKCLMYSPNSHVPPSVEIK